MVNFYPCMFSFMRILVQNFYTLEDIVLSQSFRCYSVKKIIPPVGKTRQNTEGEISKEDSENSVQDDNSPNE